MTPQTYQTVRFLLFLQSDNRPVKLSRPNWIYERDFAPTEQTFPGWVRPERVFEELWDHEGRRVRVPLWHPKNKWLGAGPSLESETSWSIKVDSVAAGRAVDPSAILISNWSPDLLMMFTFRGRAHWFTATWSITGNGTPARTAVHNYLPLYGLMGTGEDYNWSIQWINKQKSPWQNAGKSSKPLATTPTPILPLPNLYFRFGEKETIPRGVYRFIYYLWESSHTWRMPGWHAREIF